MEFTRNEKNEPETEFSTKVKVRRMDNSLAMTMEVATLSRNDKKIGAVQTAFGTGLVIDVYGENKGDKTAVYGIELMPLINEVLELHEKFKELKVIRFKKDAKTS